MPTDNKPRITSVDLLKGVVIILMALDHVRDFFHADAYLYDPTDLSQTTAPIFLTRFITHFCAPVFVFLAGTSAFFVGRRLNKKDLSIWLLKRGLWLVIAEITIIKLGWTFKLDYTFVVLQVIWALGACMIFLSALIHVPPKILLSICLIGIFGHNALDHYNPETALWNILHSRGLVTTTPPFIFPAYPLIPWIFVMPLGYLLGALYVTDFNTIKRQKMLLQIGLSSIFIFIIIRTFSSYGEPNIRTGFSWSVQSFLEYINVTKYPPSLLYLLITLGPSLVFLSLAEKMRGKFHDALVLVGRVPMFFYIIHIYVIHALAVIAAMALGYSPSVMIIDRFVTLQPELQGYGFGLWMVYAVWIIVVLALYPLCKWYWNYKSTHRQHWWLTYV